MIDEKFISEKQYCNIIKWLNTAIHAGIVAPVLVVIAGMLYAGYVGEVEWYWFFTSVVMNIVLGFSVKFYVKTLFQSWKYPDGLFIKKVEILKNGFLIYAIPYYAINLLMLGGIITIWIAGSMSFGEVIATYRGFGIHLVQLIVPGIMFAQYLRVRRRAFATAKQMEHELKTATAVSTATR